MRILNIITGLEKGGAETVLFRLLTRLQERGFENRVVCLMPRGIMADDLEKIGVPVDALAWPRGRFTVRGLLRLGRIAKDYRPDLLSGWMYHGDLAASWTAMISHRGTPVVWNIHHTLTDMKLERRTTRIVINACRFLSRTVDHIVYVAQSSRESHRNFGFAATSDSVILNGFDTRRFHSCPEARQRFRRELGLRERPAIAVVGRWHPIKDYENFFRAARLVRDARPEVEIVAVGRGLTRSNDELDSLLAACSLKEHVHLLGERRDMLDVFNGIDLLVVSSLSEGFPTVVGEAMACGTPVVSTDVGDVSLLLRDTGTVVPIRDPVALSDAVVRILTLSTDQQRALGVRARARIEADFSLESSVRSYAEVYRTYGSKT